MKTDMWLECPISKIGSVVGGGTPSTKNKSYYDGNISWITPKDLSNFHDRYIFCGERSISAEGYSNSSAQMIPAGSVLFSSRAPIGYIAIAGKEMCTNQGFKSVVPDSKICDSIFLYYLLSYYKHDIEAIASGTTFLEVSGTAMKNFRVKLPSLPLQQKIAKILSSLDDKIELNTRINRNLEEQAKAIFKSWFVDFEPFQDGEFIDSELGKIPQGWRIGTLSDLLLQRKESIHPGTCDWPYLPIDRIPMRSLGIIDFAPTEEAQSSLLAFHKNDIIIGAMRVYFHRVVLAPCQGITRSTCFTLYPKKDFMLEFCLLLCDTDDTIDYAQSTSKGSTMPYAVWDGALAEKKVIIPPDEVLKKFKYITNPVVLKIRDNYKEQLTLSQLRDTLLPKLMSGEIDVSEVAI